LFGSTSPATTTAVLANVVGSPNINCGGSAAQLVNGLPNPCYSAANFTDPTNNFGTQRRNQFRGPAYFDTDFDVEKAFTVRWPRLWPPRTRTGDVQSMASAPLLAQTFDMVFTHYVRPSNTRDAAPVVPGLSCG
jgi:hypothetical protein